MKLTPKVSKPNIYILKEENMKKLTFLILSLLISSLVSKAGSGSCTLNSSVSGSAQCSTSDYNNSSGLWYISGTSNWVSVHGWGTVNSWAPENNYLIIESVTGSEYSAYAGYHWDISYDNSFSDAQSYGSQVDFYGSLPTDHVGTLYLCVRSSNGADGGVYASW